jgi:hypothetical protein
LADKKLTRIWISKDAHRIIKSNSALYGVPATKFVDMMVKKENKDDWRFNFGKIL